MSEHIIKVEPLTIDYNGCNRCPYVREADNLRVISSQMYHLIRRMDDKGVQPLHITVVLLGDRMRRLGFDIGSDDESRRTT